jgi:hypothetical protein
VAQHLKSGDSPERLTIPSHRPLPTQHTTKTRDEQPCRRRDSNTRSQQSNGQIYVLGLFLWNKTTTGSICPDLLYFVLHCVMCRSYIVIYSGNKTGRDCSRINRWGKYLGLWKRQWRGSVKTEWWESCRYSLCPKHFDTVHSVQHNTVIILTKKTNHVHAQIV